jgi:hypothetical protein
MPDKLVGLRLHPVRFLTSDGQLYDMDFRDIEEAFERDPEGRKMPGDNPNELLLTAEDSVWLWMRGIGF